MVTVIEHQPGLSAADADVFSSDDNNFVLMHGMIPASYCNATIAQKRIVGNQKDGNTLGVWDVSIYREKVTETDRHLLVIYGHKENNCNIRREIP